MVNYMSLVLLAVAILTAEPAALFQGSVKTQQSGADRSPLQIVAVEVSRAGRGAATAETAATPDTLYRLRVKIRNNGSEPASDFSFQVTVSGQRLAPYVNHTFRSDVAPGKETEIQLYNFWSSESGRLFPADGRLVVEVRLTSARWMAANKKPVDVQPLPAPFAVTLSRKGS